MSDSLSDTVMTPAVHAACDDLSASVIALSTALQERDCYTQHHCSRVEHLAWHFGRYLDMDEMDLSDLLLAARFHDVGKIGIPDMVLLKPGRLDEAERAIMRTHSERGQRVFLATGRPDARRVGLLIRQHHEAWDGSGYPDGLAGKAIEPGARMLAIVDGYDAMTTTRPYRVAMEHERAMAILREESGSRLDPALVAAFEAMMLTQPELMLAGCESVCA